MFSPYELRSVARTGAGVPEARPEGSEGPLTAGSPPGPTLMGRGGSGLGGADGGWLVTTRHLCHGWHSGLDTAGRSATLASRGVVWRSRASGCM